MTFIERFRGLVAERSAFCLGVDPSAAVLAHWDCADTADGLSKFCTKLVEKIDNAADSSFAPRSTSSAPSSATTPNTATSPAPSNTTPNASASTTPNASLPAMVKPQSAYFERHGAAGITALHNFTRAMQKRNVLVLLDAKRGDIGETNTAYAEAYFGKGGLGVDAITIQPFMGFAALAPFFQAAQAHNGYVFVVTASSNTEGIALQQAHLQGTQQSVSEHISEAIAAQNNISPICGAVIGATRNDITDEMRTHLQDALILAPGIGAQGGGYEAFAVFPNPHNVIPTSARGVLLAQNFEQSLRDQCHQAMALR